MQAELTPEQIQKFNKAVDGGATFFFRPFTTLKNKVAQNDDPIISGLPSFMREAILTCNSEQGIWLDPKLILKRLEGKLDKRNEYILSMGEIRVAGAGDMVIYPGKINNNEFIELD